MSRGVPNTALSAAPSANGAGGLPIAIRLVRPSQRQMNRSPAPFGLFAARHRQQYFLNGLADREPVIQDENAWHSFACGQSFVRMIRHGRAVVCQDNAVVLGRPSEDIRVIRTGEADILHAHNVEVRLTQQQSAHNVPVEVLIGQQSQHASSSRLPPGEQASADVAQVALLTFNPFPNFLRLLLAPVQILLDFAPVTQVVGDDGVHVG